MYNLDSGRLVVSLNARNYQEAKAALEILTNRLESEYEFSSEPISISVVVTNEGEVE